MLQIVKHIITLSLCLLITGGAVGVRVYVSACTHSGEVQLAMSKIHRTCCSHDDDAPEEQSHESGYFVAHEDECCTTSSLSISVSHFKVSQASKLSVDLPFVTIPNLLHVADGGSGSLAPAAARLPRIAGVASTPVIYLHGQLRL